ncbi:protein masquerade-like [Contarinia nasturtii]|uniref:protein masquerade-like n=1 Tax=Contarinia nasturtii TaxID=265458 RepID=UPI0012D467E9|nr:protein masquerade-like [Contarinia nasturtii]
MRWTVYLLGICVLATSSKAQDDSFAGTFLSGLLDSITSTAEVKECPGICVHSFATIICYEVLEDVQCPSSNMKCCVESNNTASATAQSQSQSTTQKPIKITTAASPPTSKPTQKATEKPTKSETNKEGKLSSGNHLHANYILVQYTKLCSLFFSAVS